MASFDKKARSYNAPFTVSHPDLGLRAFMGAANTPDNVVNKHPEDFSLFLFGTYDDQTGLFTLHSTPQHVAEAINLRKPVPEVRSNQGEE